MNEPHADPLTLSYKPTSPRTYRPGIGLIGCGGITEHHLSAYRSAGFHVVALCDIRRSAAEKRREEYFPQAHVYDDWRELLQDDEVHITDIATHTDIRPPIIQAALESGKHVLSQKPFVIDLDEGLRLVELADKLNRKLAVNQNGRWAPHFSYARSAVQAGILGTVISMQMAVDWDHTWVVGTRFENMRHLILYDFAIHWFDMVRCLFGDRPARRVFASSSVATNQPMQEPLLGQAAIQLENGQASLQFNGMTQVGGLDRCVVTGTKGILECHGKSYLDQEVTITTEHGQFQPILEGSWFPDGFHGTMGELQCSIEEDRDCTLNARDNLKSLELCFAAVASDGSGQPVVPGSVRKLPE